MDYSSDDDDEGAAAAPCAAAERASLVLSAAPLAVAGNIGAGFIAPAGDMLVPDSDEKAASAPLQGAAGALLDTTAGSE
jgi:hypothetical protein